MKVLSVNLATPTTIEFNKETLPTGIYKQSVAGAVTVGEFGLESDTIVDKSVHGGLDQALYLYHREDYDWWSDQLGKPVENGAFGENLTIEGATEIDWVIGDRIVINGIELEITGPRVPCFKLGAKMGDPAIVKKFVNACRPGAYARVIKGGEIKAGDELLVRKTAEDYASVKEVFTEWHNKNRDQAILRKALASPIAIVHKTRIQEWLG